MRKFSCVLAMVCLITSHVTATIWVDNYSVIENEQLNLEQRVAHLEREIQSILKFINDKNERDNVQLKDICNCKPISNSPDQTADQMVHKRPMPPMRSTINSRSKRSADEGNDISPSTKEKVEISRDKFVGNHQIESQESVARLDRLERRLDELATEHEYLQIIPVIANLTKTTVGSSWCEQQQKSENLNKVVDYFNHFNDFRSPFKIWRPDRNEVSRQVNQWRIAYLLCNFTLNQTYGCKNNTILNLATGLDDLQTVKILMRKQFDIPPTDGDGNSPLHYAAAFNSSQALKWILNHSVNVNDRNNKRQTPLHLAVLGQSIEAAEMLIQHGADIHATDGDGWIPLHLVSDVKLAKLLIDSGSDLNARSNASNTPLHEIVGQLNSTEIIRLMLQKGADVNAKNGQGNTPLQMVLGKSRKLMYEKIKLLVDNGALVNVTNDRNETLLHLAASGSDAIPVMQFLLDHGLDINARDNGGNTTIYFSFYQSSPENLQFLIDHGADINIQRQDGQTPLHLASSVTYHWPLDDGFIQILLNHKAHLNVQDKNGQSALHLAVESDCFQCVKTLVVNGIDTRLIDHEGRTAYKLSKNLGGNINQEIRPYLKQHPH